MSGQQITTQQLVALMPIIALSVTAIVLMLQASIKRSRGASWLITATGIVATLWSAGYCLGLDLEVTPLIVVDDWSLFFVILVVVAATVTLILFHDEGLSGGGRNEEFCLLLILATLGAVVLVQANHMASLFLGLELMGISLYAMIAFPREWQRPLEASIKYLVLSAAASTILLFGFALLYAATGDLSFPGMGVKAALAWGESPVLVAAAATMILVGLGFKLSVVPFHMWTPDVYQGAPTVVTGFLATVSKGAVFVVLTRFFLVGNLLQYDNLLIVLSALAIASMVIGNLLALRQNNLKRLLAYSSIAHFGYLLVVLVAAAVNGARVIEAVTFYLAAYILTTLAAFAVVSMVAGDDDSKCSMHSIQGLFWHRPLLAMALTVAMLSLAGIPLTAGFVGKFYVINAGIQAALWWPIGALVVGSAIAIYYYLRVVFAMTAAPQGAGAAVAEKSNIGLQLLTVVLMLLVLLLGTWPQPLIELIGVIGI